MNFKGTCSCKDGFVGDDCSIKLSDAPKIDRIFYKDNRCDIKNTKISCSIVLIRGTGLSTKENGVKLLYKPVINVKDVFIMRVFSFFSNFHFLGDCYS